MKKALIFIASAVALTASAIILFRKCKNKKGVTFSKIYEDNAPSECPLCGGELCCKYADQCMDEFSCNCDLQWEDSK